MIAAKFFGFSRVITFVVIFILAIVFLLYAIAFVLSVASKVTSDIRIKRESPIYLEWIKSQGVAFLENSPVKNSEVWSWCEKKGLAKRMNNSYVVSTDFYESMVQNLFAQVKISREDINAICQHTLSTFQTQNLTAFLIFLEKKNILLKIPTLAEGKCYLTKKAIFDCEMLFKGEGGVTENEFKEICQQSETVGNLGIDYQEFSRKILKNLVDRGEVEVVEVSGQKLFISKKLSSSAKMTRVEIDLDS